MVRRVLRPDRSGAEFGNPDLLAVTSLNLPNNNLVGSIPPQLGDLLSLDTLDLFGNSLNQGIPDALFKQADVGYTPVLSYLSLDINNLTGPVP